MIEKDYIKELFQEKLTSHEVPVRADLWTSVSSSIGGSSVVASSMSIATKLLIAASVSAVALVTFYLVNDKNSVPTPIKKENPQEQRIITIDSLKIEKEEVKKMKNSFQHKQGSELTARMIFQHLKMSLI